MQLKLARSQEQTRRSVVFVLTATAAPTQEEMQLMQKYQLLNEVVAMGTMTVGLLSKQQVPFQVRASHLVQGYTQKFEDLGSMLDFESRMKGSCQMLMHYLEAARKFGGQEVIDIHLEKEAVAARPSLA